MSTGKTQLVVTPPDLKDGGKKAVARIILESAAQLNPFTAALSTVYGYTYPSDFERDLERFRLEVAQKLTDHEEQLNNLLEYLSPRAVISDVAMDLAIRLLQANTTGRPDPVLFEQIAEVMGHVARDRLEEAVAELGTYEFVTISSALGHTILQVRPTSAAFLAFDKAATGHDTQADAVHIASLWLENDKFRSVFSLSEHLGWPPRRLNPPLAALRPVFPEGRWSREVHPVLETTSVLITPDERFQLRRIVESGRVG